MHELGARGVGRGERGGGEGAVLFGGEEEGELFEGGAGDDELVEVEDDLAAVLLFEVEFHGVEGAVEELGFVFVDEFEGEFGHFAGEGVFG